MNEKSLIRLVMRNWVSIWSIKSIISNIANPNNQQNIFKFGKNQDDDHSFLLTIRQTLDSTHLDNLGINDISNAKLLSELYKLNLQIINGTPVIKVKQNCKKIQVNPQLPCEPKIVIKETCTHPQPQPRPQVQHTCVFEQCRGMCEVYCSNLMQTYNSG